MDPFCLHFFYIDSTLSPNVVILGYRERRELRPASKEPVIVEPEIHGGIEIDSNTRFLILMSDGLYNALAEATGTATPNAGSFSPTLQIDLLVWLERFTWSTRPFLQSTCEVTN